MARTRNAKAPTAKEKKAAAALDARVAKAATAKAKAAANAKAARPTKVGGGKKKLMVSGSTKAMRRWQKSKAGEGPAIKSVQIGNKPPEAKLEYQVRALAAVALDRVDLDTLEAPVTPGAFVRFTRKGAYLTGDFEDLATAVARRAGIDSEELQAMLIQTIEHGLRDDDEFTDTLRDLALVAMTYEAAYLVELAATQADESDTAELQIRGRYADYVSRGAIVVSSDEDEEEDEDDATSLVEMQAAVDAIAIDKAKVSLQKPGGKRGPDGLDAEGSTKKKTKHGLNAIDADVVAAKAAIAREESDANPADVAFITAVTAIARVLRSDGRRWSKAKIREFACGRVDVGDFDSVDISKVLLSLETIELFDVLPEQHEATSRVSVLNSRADNIGFGAYGTKKTVGPGHDWINTPFSGRTATTVEQGKYLCLFSACGPQSRSDVDITGGPGTVTITGDATTVKPNDAGVMKMTPFAYEETLTRWSLTDELYFPVDEKGVRAHLTYVKYLTKTFFNFPDGARRYDCMYRRNVAEARTGGFAWSWTKDDHLYRMIFDGKMASRCVCGSTAHTVENCTTGDGRGGGGGSGGRGDAGRSTDTGKFSGMKIKGACVRHNTAKGCDIAGCTFTHVCMSCGGKNHTIAECKTKKD